MNTTELQQGDWVKPVDTIFPTKVLAILDFDEILCRPNDDDKATNYYAICCEPIPIANELLELNGFEKVGAYYIIYAGQIIVGQKNFSREFYADGRGPDSFIKIDHLDLNYVHELQHFLRLIGLVDLANNFKINP